jgi:hypothetical protein
MKRILVAAFAIAFFAPIASASDLPVAGLKCSSICLTCFGKLHQHGPLYNYGPYYGYPPFEPYGPWNQYLQYGAYSGYSYGSSSLPAVSGGSSSACPTCSAGSSTSQPVIRPQMTATNSYGYPGYYNPYYPATPYYSQYAPQYAPQYVPQQGVPVVPVQYRR